MTMIEIILLLVGCVFMIEVFSSAKNYLLQS